MNNFITKLIIGCGLITALYSCASKVGTQSQSSGYSEDLTLYRPLYPDPKPDTFTYEVIEKEEITFVEPEHSITNELDSLLDSIAAYSKSRGFYQVFAIQIYNGTSSTEANDAKRLSYKEFPDEIPVLEYNQPIFRVKVGRFLERIDANKQLNEFREVFPNAILIPERVYR